MEQNETQIAEQKQRYSPAQTAEIKRRGITEVIKAQRKMMNRRGQGIDLFDVKEVEQAINDYLQTCEDDAILPTILGFCSMARVSRDWFYQFLSDHKGTDTAQLLEHLKVVCASVRMSAVDRGAASETFSIFLLKNSGLNFADRVEITPAIPQSPLSDLNATEARKRIMEGIPDDDGWEE